MIHYAIKCTEGHEFDSWFQSASAFDKLVAAGMVPCVVCGKTDVAKAIMTPRVRTGRKAASRPDTDDTRNTDLPVPSDTNPQPSPPPLSEAKNPAEQALAELRKKVEETADYVGKDFADEARAMHLGDTPVRSIYGEAGLEEAKQLVEDGVPVAPLPFRPNRKVN